LIGPNWHASALDAHTINDLLIHLRHLEWHALILRDSQATGAYQECT
jgi:hypothetical protein